MPKKAFRSQEVLWIIAKYGVISTKVLRLILSDKLGSRWLRQVLEKLEQRGLTIRATSNIGGRPVDYWMLSKEGASVIRTSKITEINQGNLRHKSSKYTHYPHEDLCTLFQVSVERQMPSVQVIREATGSMKDVPDNILSRRLRNLGYAPDLVLRLPFEGKTTNNNESVKWVAVEIDRTYRTLKRLSQRVNMYARHTGFEGLLYLMPTELCLKTLMKVFEGRGAQEAFRIKGSEKSFLACGVVNDSFFDVNNVEIVVGGKSVSLSAWLSIVALTSKGKRDLEFQRYSSHREYFEEKSQKSLSI